MKKVIAFCLWGDAPMYWVGAVRNVQLASVFFPDWICRFYIEESCVERAKNEFSPYIDRIEIIPKNIKDTENDYVGCYWRIDALADPEVDIVIGRDTDSRFNYREQQAVNEWLESDKSFHTMRDHPLHSIPCLGGLWGCKTAILRNNNVDVLGLVDQYRASNSSTEKGSEQYFLSNVIYYMLRPFTMEHSSFRFAFEDENISDVRPFPVERIGCEYVGDIFNEYDQRDGIHFALVKFGRMFSERHTNS